MLYICIPAYNEAPTVGLLLWRIRKVFQSYSREYEILVFNDGSTDATVETLKPYHDVLPLTVIGGKAHVGYARALDELARTASQRTRYPRRDALITLQADFTDPPEHLPELIKRFEGGADLVVAERAADLLPPPARRLRRVAPWILRPFVRVPEITDPFGSLRLYRVSLIRDLLKTLGDKPLVEGDGWAANVDLLVRASKFARRIETVSLDARYDLRPRESRVRPLRDALSLFRFARGLRNPPAVTGFGLDRAAGPTLAPPARGVWTHDADDEVHHASHDRNLDRQEHQHPQNREQRAKEPKRQLEHKQPEYGKQPDHEHCANHRRNSSCGAIPITAGKPYPWGAGPATWERPRISSYGSTPAKSFTHNSIAC